MKYMYGAVINESLIAIHDDRDVVESYISKYERDNNKSVDLVKCPKKKLKKISGYEDLYLLRVGDNYVPTKYYSTNENITNEALYDLKYARDVILRILEYRSNGAKSLEKTVQILEEEISNISENVLSIELLDDIKTLNNERKRKL